MFSWSRGEVWLAVVISATLVVGTAGHLWLTHERLQGASVVVEAAATEIVEKSEVDQGGDDRCADEERGSAVEQRININTAQPSELERLPGIGPALAARIVEYRTAWGPFSVIEDILEVSGIGPRKFQNIQDLIEID